MFQRAWDKEVPLSYCPDPPEGRYPWDMLSGTSRPGISPPTPARPSRALACQQGVPGLWGRERWCGRASPTGRPHPTTHLMGRSSCVRWTTSRERPELVPRGRRGKKERVQGEGLGRVMHTRGACVPYCAHGGWRAGKAGRDRRSACSVAVGSDLWTLKLSPRWAGGCGATADATSGRVGRRNAP